MVRFRAIAARTALVTAAAVTVIGVPTAAHAAPTVNAGPAAIQQNACDTVASVAGPVLRLLDLGLINTDTAVQMIADLTGLPAAEVAACLGF